MTDELVLVEQERRDGYLLLNLRGEIDLSNVDYLQQRIDLMSSGSAHIVINLAGIEYMDSQGLRLLRQMSSRLAKRGNRLQLIAPPGSFARGLFDMTSMSVDIEVLDTSLS